MRHKLLPFLLLAISLCSPTYAKDLPWQTGVARVNITPELPIWLSGYAARTKPADDKLSDLWAKALVLEDPTGQRAVLVTIDLVGIDRDLSRDVCRRIESQFGLPRAAVALCVSHTHSGPVVGTNLAPMYALDPQQADRIKSYTATLADRLVAVVGDALAARQPARLARSVGQATFAVNRRNNPEPEVPQRRAAGTLVGPVDHDVPVLAVYGAEDALRAVVCGYACHATVIDGYQVSGDWPGAAQRELERRHPDTIALYWAGCGGDQNPLPRRSVDFVHQYGGQMADAVDAALASSPQPVPAALTVTYKEIDLPFAPLPTRAEFEAYAVSKPPHTFWAKHLLAAWDRDGSLPTTYPYPIQAWRLGNELEWVFLGGEVVVDYALRLKAELGPQKTWVASYSNDVMGYIPSRRVLGEGGYEGGESRYYYGLPAVWGPDTERHVVEAVRRLTRHE